MKTAQTEYEELLNWLDGKGDVDRKAFLEACDSIARVATWDYGIRVPRVAKGKGVLTLDYALSLMGQVVPREIWDSDLPGAKEFRDLGL